MKISEVALLLAWTPVDPLIVQEAIFADRFRGSKELTFDHFYAAIIQTRGNILNDPPCNRCSNEETSCVSKAGVGNDTCASDIWHRKGSSCAYSQPYQVKQRWLIPSRQGVRDDSQSGGVASQPLDNFGQYQNSNCREGPPWSGSSTT